MKVYIKYLVLLFFKSFFYVLAVMATLVFILNLLGEIEFFRDINTSANFTLILSLLNSPDMIFEMFPFIFLIATQLFFHDLNNNNQINTLKYSGLKNSKILIIINILTLFFGVIIITFYYNISSTLKSCLIPIF